jgi:hypothetical protein
LPEAGGRRHVFIAWLSYAVGCGAAIVPITAYFLAVVPGKELYEIFIEFPAHIYPRYRSLPIPHLGRLASHALPSIMTWLRELHNTLGFYFPIVIFVTTGILLLGFRRRIAAEPRYSLLCGLTVFGIALEFTARIRPDMQHLTAPVSVSMILFPWVYLTVPRALGSMGGVFVKASLAVGLASLALGCAFFAAADYNGDLGPPAEWKRVVTLPLERARGITLFKSEVGGLPDAVRYIQSHTGPDERIFVANTRNDKIYVNHAMFNFLAERRSSTRYNDMHPGVTTKAGAQQEEINELRRYHVRCVVLWEQPDVFDIMTPDSTLLGEFLRAEYREVARFGNLRVLFRGNDNYRWSTLKHDGSGGAVKR